MKKYYITALIPARSGSKGIKNKNIKNYNGRPLILYSIEQGIKSKYIDKVIVSTDSEIYAELSRENGAEVPFIRPKEISNDLSTDYEFFSHYINWLNEFGEKIPDFIVLLRPTYPSRKVADIDRAIETFVASYDLVDSLKSVVLADKTPYKMWSLKNGFMEPLLEIKNQKEAFNLPRQLLPDIYWQNACIDIVKTTIINNSSSISGKNILPYVMNDDEVHDIDTIEDFNKSIKHRS